MIRSFKHRGLKRLYERGERQQLRHDHLNRIEDMLARLDIADNPTDLDLPGYALHPLKGKLKGFWAIKVSGNWRIIFRCKDGEILDVDLVDYH
ncbi:MAG TPA: type II toxin-antitoxin system RelE/ParE family toxin [Gammaproteobacteria bacterium]|nr:type II toxin-antitoxin system RelE/ParE family toxin [Gammaproteobacteria bacterium]